MIGYQNFAPLLFYCDLKILEKSFTARVLCTTLWSSARHIMEVQYYMGVHPILCKHHQNHFYTEIVRGLFAIYQPYYTLLTNMDSTNFLCFAYGRGSSAGLYTLLYQQIADSIYFLKSYFLKQKMALFFSCLGG